MQIFTCYLTRIYAICLMSLFKSSKIESSNADCSLNWESIHSPWLRGSDHTQLLTLFSALKTTFGAAAECRRASLSATDLTQGQSSSQLSSVWTRKLMLFTSAAANFQPMRHIAMVKLVSSCKMARSSRCQCRWSKRPKNDYFIYLVVL